MKKGLLCALLLAVLMFAEYRAIMRSISPHMAGNGCLVLSVFGFDDVYTIE